MKEKTKPTRTPEKCPLILDMDGIKKCVVKMTKCDVYEVYGFCPVWKSFQQGNKFCTVQVET